VGKRYVDYSKGTASTTRELEEHKNGGRRIKRSIGGADALGSFHYIGYHIVVEAAPSGAGNVDTCQSRQVKTKYRNREDGGQQQRGKGHTKTGHAPHQQGTLLPCYKRSRKGSRFQQKVVSRALKESTAGLSFLSLVIFVFSWLSRGSSRHSTNSSRSHHVRALSIVTSCRTTTQVLHRTYQETISTKRHICNGHTKPHKGQKQGRGRDLSLGPNMESKAILTSKGIALVTGGTKNNQTRRRVREKTP